MQVDVVILEVGLGGRFDATNVVGKIDYFYVRLRFGLPGFVTNKAYVNIDSETCRLWYFFSRV